MNYHVDESVFDKKRGPFKVCIERSDGEDDRFIVSVIFGITIENMSKTEAKEEGEKLLNAIRLSLGRKGIKPVEGMHDVRAEDLRILSLEVAMPPGMAASDVYDAYEEAFKRADSMLKVASEDTEVRDTAIITTLRKAMVRHGIKEGDADDCPRAVAGIVESCRSKRTKSKNTLEA